MEPLSIEHINETSSYQVELTDKEGFYQFFTAGGVHYSVGFMEDDILLANNSYQLIIANINNHKSPRDRKALYTMMSSSIIDMDGVVNFATRILRNDNQHLADIITEFTESIRLLSQKPE